MMMMMAPIRPELRDPSEHLTADDQAALQSAQFAERALLVQRLAASAAPRAVPGRCANCGGACAAPAVYCDEDCREDHERRRGRHP